jgi:predicted nucleotidyltransferase
MSPPVRMEELLRPPSNEEVESALTQFAANVRQHYGSRLKGLYLFGSRARGDHRPDSDADVAVILAEGDWVAWEQRRVLNRLGYETSLESGLYIQAWPFSVGRWECADRNASRGLIEAARREAVPLG